MSWRATDGDSQSAVAYALTANGEITFPEAVAGAAHLTVQSAALADGVLYSMTLPVVICTDPQTVTLPSEPAAARYSVVVRMPNGQPVVGATVTASGLSSTMNGFDASALGSAYSPTTDGSGTAALVGYVTGTPSVRVVYSDGVLDQAKTATLSGSTTSVQLQYMPWLTVPSTTNTVAGGNLDSINFSVDSFIGAQRRSGSRSPLSSVRGSLAGVTVLLTPPAGWRAKRCKHASKLSGKRTRRTD